VGILEISIDIITEQKRTHAEAQRSQRKALN